MEREHRYYVAKKKDVEKYLSDEQQLQFDRLLTKIRVGRLNDGKSNVQTVCVDSDWPEYETVWKMIEARVDGKASPASVPEGYVVVPVEPTLEMFNAGDGAFFTAYTGTATSSPDRVYKAMIAAAPTPPVSEDRKDAERFRDGWAHSCNALCMEIELWIARCPHCGRPAPKAPTMQEDKP